MGKIIDYCINPDKLNRFVLNILAFSLVLSCLLIPIHTLIFHGSEGFWSAMASTLFFFISTILLMAATVHLSTSLLSSSEPKKLKKELLSAILMSAFSITLVALHKGIEMFINDHGTHQYGTSDALLIIFVISGGVFMVATIWVTRNIRGYQ